MTSRRQAKLNRFSDQPIPVPVQDPGSASYVEVEVGVEVEVDVDSCIDSKASDIFNSTSGLDIDRLHCSNAKELDLLVSSQANKALQMFLFSTLMCCLLHCWLRC